MAQKGKGQQEPAPETEPELDASTETTEDQSIPPTESDTEAGGEAVEEEVELDPADVDEEEAGGGAAEGEPEAEQPEEEVVEEEGGSELDEASEDPHAPGVGRDNKGRPSGNRTGWFNQLSAEELGLMDSDPAAFVERLKRNRAVAEMGYERPVSRAIKSVLAKWGPKMAPATREFYEDLTKVLAESLSEEVRQESMTSASSANRQHVTSTQMAKISKTKLWKNQRFQREFWGEVHFMKNRRQWEPPEVLFRRVERQFVPGATGGGGRPSGGGGSSPRRPPVGERGRAGAGGSAPAGKKLTARETWLRSPAARDLDRRERG